MTPVTGIYYRLASRPHVPITVAATIGDIARRAAMSRYGEVSDGQTTVRLSGHEGEGKTLGGHRHAYYLPLDDDGDGWLDHLLVYAPEPFEVSELEALVTLRRLWGRRQADIVIEVDALISDDSSRQRVPACRASRTWASVTPMFLSRHPKRHRDGRPKRTERGEQVDGPEDQVRRDWAFYREQLAMAESEALPALVRVQRVPAHRLRTGQSVPWPMYACHKSEAKGPAVSVPFGLLLEFAGPVAGPLAFGYGRHVGLGLFRPLP